MCIRLIHLQKSLLVLMAVASLASAQLMRQGLVAWYPFVEGRINDYSGNRRHLQYGSYLTGGVPWSPPLPCNDRHDSARSALEYYYIDSTGYYTECCGMRRYGSSYPAGNSARTVCFWVSVHPRTTSRGPVVAWGRAANRFGVFLGRYYTSASSSTDGLLVRGFAQPCSVRVSLGPQQISDSVWTFVSVVYNGSGQVSIRVNDSTAAEFTVSTTNTDTVGDTLFVGSKLHGGGILTGDSGICMAKLDDICIYGRALSRTELTMIYRANGRFNQPPAIVNPARDTTIPRNVTYARSVTASDPDGQPFTFALEQGPTGYYVAGYAQGLPANTAPVGRHTVIYFVTDSWDTTRDTFILTIAQPIGVLRREPVRAPWVVVSEVPFFDLAGRRLLGAEPVGVRLRSGPRGAMVADVPLR